MTQTAMFRGSLYWRGLRSWLLSLPAGSPLRVWVAAASSGEEVESLILLLQETRLDSYVMVSDISEGPLLRWVYGLPETPLPGEVYSRVFGADALAEYSPVSSVRLEVLGYPVDIAGALPEDEGFDLILARNVFPYIYGPDAVVGRLLTRLKPGGRIDFGQIDSGVGLTGSRFRLS